jgi:hypothetical protein
MYDWFREGIFVSAEVTTVLGSVSVKEAEDMFQSRRPTVGNWDGSVTAWVDTDPQPGVVGTLGVAALRNVQMCAGSASAASGCGLRRAFARQHLAGLAIEIVADFLQRF